MLVMLWRIILHIFLTHKENEKASQEAVIVIRDSALLASCFLGSNAQVWLIAEQALNELPQLIRCQLYHHTATALHMKPLPLKEQSHGMLQDALLQLLQVQEKRNDGQLGSLAKKMPIPRTKEDIEKVCCMSQSMGFKVQAC